MCLNKSLVSLPCVFLFHVSCLLWAGLKINLPQSQANCMCEQVKLRHKSAVLVFVNCLIFSITGFRRGSDFMVLQLTSSQVFQWSQLKLENVHRSGKWRGKTEAFILTLFDCISGQTDFISISYITSWEHHMPILCHDIVSVETCFLSRVHVGIITQICT